LKLTEEGFTEICNVRGSRAKVLIVHASLPFSHVLGYQAHGPFGIHATLRDGGPDALHKRRAFVIGEYLGVNDICTGLARSNIGKLATHGIERSLEALQLVIDLISPENNA
jgi:hypothetical protein